MALTGQFSIGAYAVFMAVGRLFFCLLFLTTVPALPPHLGTASRLGRSFGPWQKPLSVRTLRGPRGLVVGVVPSAAIEMRPTPLAKIVTLGFGQIIVVFSFL